MLHGPPVVGVHVVHDDVHPDGPAPSIGLVEDAAACPCVPSITTPLPYVSSACSTEPSSPSYTDSSVKPKASVSCLIAAFASAYTSVG